MTDETGVASVSKAAGRILGMVAGPCVICALAVSVSAAAHAVHRGRVRKASAVVAETAATANVLTPPMGLDAWDQDRCKVTQQDILSNAEALVSTGLAADGYDYVILDDCWMAPTRSASGQLQPDKARFPAGIAWLAKQVHALGLKIGIYESAGRRTCHGYPGSYGHYGQDARTFARWGINYVKFDSCYIPKGVNQPALFSQFGKDLRADNPAIVYSEELPVHVAVNPASATFKEFVSISSQIANLWRVTPDEQTGTLASTTLIRALDTDLPLAGYAGPGHWNDLDLLLTGNTLFNWSKSHQQSQLSIWSEMSSPLIVSANLASPSAVAHLASRATGTGSLLMNKPVIAVDQDPVQGKSVGSYGRMKVVVKPMPSGAHAVLVANTAHVKRSVTVPLKVLGISAGASWQDLWSMYHFVASGSSVTFALGGGATVLYEVTPAATSSAAKGSGK
jgi:alpha-galactosidase